MQALFTLCAVAYLLIYAFEGVIRYGLYFVGSDSAILLRDTLVTGPLVLLLVLQAFRTRLHPAFPVFGAIVAVHGIIGALNFQTYLPVVYGAKLLVNVLFGFIAARALVLPSRKVVVLLGLVWLVSAVGVGLDKYVYTMPWMGMETHIGGISVDVSHGWDINDTASKRAAGFTRSSICAAMLLPTLALVIAMRMRSYVLRMLLLIATTGVVFLTTQKGAVVAIGLITLILGLPSFMRYRMLCWATVGFAAADVALPLFTAGLLVSHDGGVFSLASLAMRISDTWPDAWQWIANNNMFPFGVGLGGIGGAQRFYAQDFFNPADNIFIFLYANFGVLSLVYLAWMLIQGLRQPPETQAVAIAPLVLLAFNLGYGMALSMLEDQVSQLFLGASVGMLWQLRQIAAANPWANAFRGATFSYAPALTFNPKQPAHAAELP